MTSPDVVYDLDGLDTIVAVNEAWDRFAEENASPWLVSRDVVGRPIWDFLSDPTTIEIYRRLFEKARSGAPPSRFEFRCDSPGVRRLLEMQMTPAEGVIRCTVRTVSLEDREFQPLLDPSVRRSEQLLRMCSWCKRIPDAAGTWHEIDDAESIATVFRNEMLPAVTHGICDDCSTSMTAGL